jgi:hypothetical protein
MHNLDPKHFPLELWDTPRDKAGKTLPGEPPRLVGYACAKCDHKNQRDKFIKEHGIKAEGGRGLRQAIQDKEKELKFKSKIVKEITPRHEKQNLFQRIKNKLSLGRQMRGGK